LRVQGLEEALLAAISKEGLLVNPAELFKASACETDIDAEDAAYWNVDDVNAAEPVQPMVLVAEQEPAPVATVPFAQPPKPPKPLPLPQPHPAPRQRSSGNRNAPHTLPLFMTQGSEIAVQMPLF
jgi:outer membrane biosynthesis protein TonB